MSKTIRFATLLKNHGPIKRATHCSELEWNLAVREKRFCTAYHCENDHATPVEALVNHHGCVNTLCKLTFSKSLPPDVTRIIGMRNNSVAFDLCNP